jgi:hypothetical protein
MRRKNHITEPHQTTAYRETSPQNFREEKIEMKEVTDLYEAAFFICNGCKIESVECVSLSGSLACRFLMSGEKLPELEETFFTRSAVVNLYSFRSAYGQVNSFMHEAKKRYDRQLRELRRTGGEL